MYILLNIFELRRINKKFESNPERPRRPGHWRVVVRPVCIASARRGGKPGGYPNIKASPVIKCTMKGLTRRLRKDFAIPRDREI